MKRMTFTLVLFLLSSLILQVKVDAQFIPVAGTSYYLLQKASNLVMGSALINSVNTPVLAIPLTNNGPELFTFTLMNAAYPGVYYVQNSNGYLCDDGNYTLTFQPDTIAKPTSATAHYHFTLPASTVTGYYLLNQKDRANDAATNAGAVTLGSAFYSDKSDTPNNANAEFSILTPDQVTFTQGLTVSEDSLKVETGLQPIPLVFSPVNITAKINIDVPAGFTTDVTSITPVNGTAYTVNVNSTAPAGTTGVLTLYTGSVNAKVVLYTIKLTAVAPYTRYFISNSSGFVIGALSTKSTQPAIVTLNTNDLSQIFILRRVSATPNTYDIVQSELDYSYLNKISANTYDVSFGAKDLDQWTVTPISGNDIFTDSITISSTLSAISSKFLGPQAAATDKNLYADNSAVSGAAPVLSRWKLVDITTVPPTALSKVLVDPSVTGYVLGDLLYLNNVPEKAQVSVYTALGALVYKTANYTHAGILLKGSAVYIATVKTDSNIQSVKVIR